MQKILLLYVSRSFSTLLMRIMMNANTCVYHDRIGASIRFPQDDFNPHTVADFYITQAQANSANGQNTFVKESCWVFEAHEACLQKLLADGFVPVFLVRHPKDALCSYQKVAQQVGDAKWSTGRSIRHDLLYYFYQKYPGHLMISEDFIHQPAASLRELFSTLRASWTSIKDKNRPSTENEPANGGANALDVLAASLLMFSWMSWLCDNCYLKLAASDKKYSNSLQQLCKTKYPMWCMPAPSSHKTLCGHKFGLRTPLDSLITIWGQPN